MERTWWIRAMDNHNSSPLSIHDRAWEYDSVEEAVWELEDRGGGWIHDQTGRAVRFVAPMASRVSK